MEFPCPHKFKFTIFSLLCHPKYPEEVYLLEKPRVASKYPIDVFLEIEKEYLWCSCGRSKNEPFCDGGSHKGTGFKPLKYQVISPKTVFLCQCKQTKNPPICDGSHNHL